MISFSKCKEVFNSKYKADPINKFIKSNLILNWFVKLFQKKQFTYAADNIVRIYNLLLNSDGIFLITAPIGQHIEWNQTVFSDEILKKEFLKVKSVNVYFFKKINEIEWIQTKRDEVLNSKENYPFPGLNALSIVEIIK